MFSARMSVFPSLHLTQAVWVGIFGSRLREGEGGKGGRGGEGEEEGEGEGKGEGEKEGEEGEREGKGGRGEGRGRQTNSERAIQNSTDAIKTDDQIGIEDRHTDNETERKCGDGKKARIMADKGCNHPGEKTPTPTPPPDPTSATCANERA